VHKCCLQLVYAPTGPQRLPSPRYIPPQWPASQLGAAFLRAARWSGGLAQGALPYLYEIAAAAAAGGGASAACAAAARSAARAA
jgi:hypothetical protein